MYKFRGSAQNYAVGLWFIIMNTWALEWTLEPESTRGAYYAPTG